MFFCRMERIRGLYFAVVGSFIGKRSPTSYPKGAQSLVPLERWYNIASTIERARLFISVSYKNTYQSTRTAYVQFDLDKDPIPLKDLKWKPVDFAMCHECFNIIPKHDTNCSKHYNNLDYIPISKPKNQD